jgi:hypothetical protein
MERYVISTVALLALAGSAMAQSPYGTVEFRWRERAVGVLPTIGGVQTTVLNPLAAPSPANNSVSTPAVAGDATDAAFHLILEARVTRAQGNTDLGGLAGFAFNMVSSDTRAQGSFAANNNTGAWPENRNAASASTTIYSQIGAYTAAQGGALPGTTGRGVFGPFRRVADLGGNNQPAIGVQNLSSSGPLANNATLENITIGAQVDPLTFVDGDTGENGPYFGRNDFYGLNTWVPVYIAIYNVTDLAGRSFIDINAQIGATSPTDSGLRGFRGINTDQGVDSWQIDNGGLPTFRIAIVPAPGSAALLGLGGLLVARRRR